MSSELLNPIKESLNALAGQLILFVVVTMALGLLCLVILKFLKVPTKIAAILAQLLTLVIAYKVFMLLFS